MGGAPERRGSIPTAARPLRALPPPGVALPGAGTSAPAPYPAAAPRRAGDGVNMLLPASPRARARRGAPPSRNRLKRTLRAGTAHVRRRAPARPPPSSPTAPQLTHRAPARAACVAGRAGGRSPVQKRKRKTPPKTLSERKNGTGGRQREMFDGPGYGWVRTLGVFALWPAKTRTRAVRFFFRGASCGPQQAALALPSRLSPPAALGPWRPRGSAAGHSARAPLRERGGGCAGEGAILPRVVAGRSARPLAGATGAGGGNASLHFFRVVPRRSRCALVRVARRRGAGRA